MSETAFSTSAVRRVLSMRPWDSGLYMASKFAALKVCFDLAFSIWAAVSAGDWPEVDEPTLSAPVVAAAFDALSTRWVEDIL